MSDRRAGLKLLRVQMKQYCSNKTLAHISLVTAQLCFSGWHIVGSQALKGGADPFIFALYRELTASIMMFLVVVFSDLPIKIDKQDYVRFFLLGVCSFVNVVGAMLSLKYISATRFAIFQPSIPCIATVISILVGLEKFTWIKAVGILLAVGGAILTEVWQEGGSNEEEANVTLGTIIVSCQVFAMGCLIVFSKAMLSKYHPAVVTVVYYSTGSIITLVLCAGFAYQFTVKDLYFHGEYFSWLALAYASTFATLYPYNVLSWAGKQLSPSVTTVYCTFQPVGTILLSLIIFGTMLTLSEGIGALLVIIGLVVTVWGQRRERYGRMSEGSDRVDSDEDARVDQLLLPDPDEEQQHQYSHGTQVSVGVSLNAAYNPTYRSVSGDATRY